MRKEKISEDSILALMQQDARDLHAWCWSIPNLESYDPYDFKAQFPFSRIYQSNHRLVKNFLKPLSLAGVWLLPELSRKLLGIKKTSTASALYHLGMAEEGLLGGLRDQQSEIRTRHLMQLLELMQNAADGGWGLPFPVPHGSEIWPPTSYTHTTARIVEYFFLLQRGGRDCKVVLERAADFLTKNIRWLDQPDGRSYCSYLPHHSVWILNVIADTAFALKLLSAALPHRDFTSQINGLLQTLLQELDAKWRWDYYASCYPLSQESDSYHTAMILGSLGSFLGSSSIEKQDHLQVQFQRALQTYIGDFFALSDGKPIIRTYKAKDSAYSIADWAESAKALGRTLRYSSHTSSELLRIWQKRLLASYPWVRQTFRYSDGHFAYQYRKYLGRYDAQSLRWGNALMLEGLQTFIRELNGKNHQSISL